MWQQIESIGEALSEAFNLTSSKQPVMDKHGGDGRSRSLGLTFGHSSMQGWRDTMEDAHVVSLSKNNSPRGQPWGRSALFGVFDGHGGAQVAKFCARHLPTEMAASGLRGRTVPEALHESLHCLDTRLQDPASSEELLSLGDGKSGKLAHKCGCTVAACCILEGGDVVVANAGDCRVVLSRQGCATDLSQDHKPGLPREHARIRNAGGHVVDKIAGNRVISRINGGLSVSRSMGDFKYKQNENLPPNGQMVSCTPEIMSFRRTPQDEFLLIACDGVWDMLSSQQAVDFVRQRLPSLRDGSMKPSEVAEEVLDKCISPNLSWTDGLGGDNMTLMIVVFAEEAGHMRPSSL